MLTITTYSGPRDSLMHLFSEADDSESEIASYIDLGEVLVARDEQGIVVHVQIVMCEEAGAIEIKSIAVRDGQRSQGIGGALIEADVERCRKSGTPVIRLATAAASTDALKFYQRHGFRLVRIIPDFYVAERGYRPIEVNGIPLRDEVILEREP